MRVGGGGLVPAFCAKPKHLYSYDSINANYSYVNQSPAPPPHADKANYFSEHGKSKQRQRL